MASSSSLVKFVPLFLMVAFVIIGCTLTEARPLKAVGESGAGAWLDDDGEADWMVGLVLGNVKSGGPSPGIGHHGFINFNGMKDSGLSPGIGHKFGLNRDVKDSGPSPGIGHEFNLNGSMKNNGPSPGIGH